MIRESGDKGTIVTENGALTAIGLMSGTSMDGVDAALVETDGHRVKRLGATAFIAYDPGFRTALNALLRPDPENSPAFDHVLSELTALHADAVETLLENAGLTSSAVDVLGFHGQTVFHAPDQGITRQLGDGKSLANRTGIPVVADFRSADVAAGGQGAPFAPLYHAALAEELHGPIAVLNIGGVANVTWIGSRKDKATWAFDTGPGNALLDDWISCHGLGDYDADGALAAAGVINETVLSELMENSYFQKSPPKSLDRNKFDSTPVSMLSPEDGAATLAAFTARSIAVALDHFPEAPVRWLVCGGGRRNSTIMRMLNEILHDSVDPVESVGWSGDHLEAEAFAFLAVRSIKGLPLSIPTTTGVPQPMPGGRLFRPGDRN